SDLCREYGPTAVRRNAGGRRSSNHFVKVRGIGNEGLERTVYRVPNDDSSQFAFFGGWIGKGSSHVDRIVLAHKYRTWLPKLLPGGYEGAVLVEHLNPI